MDNVVMQNDTSFWHRFAVGIPRTCCIIRSACYAIHSVASSCDGTYPYFIKVAVLLQGLRASSGYQYFIQRIYIQPGMASSCGNALCKSATCNASEECRTVVALSQDNTSAIVSRIRETSFLSRRLRGESLSRCPSASLVAHRTCSQLAYASSVHVYTDG